MDVGLALPQYDYSAAGADRLAWDTVVEWARRAEAVGFGSVWLSDHLFLSLEKYGGPPEEHFAFDPIAALGGLSRVTDRIRLGTLVLCALFRPPAVMAKSLAGLDRLCGGRLVIGMGAGWYPAELAVAGIPLPPPGDRLAQLAEAVQVVKAMQSGEPCFFEGARVTVRGARCLPPALQQPSPPVIVGGKGDRLLELAARLADGWNTVWTWTLDGYRERLGALERACERLGRDPASLERSVGLYTLVGESEADLVRRFDRLCQRTPAGILEGVTLEQWREGHLVGTVAEVGEQLAAWSEMGVSTIIAGLGAVPFAVTDVEDLELLVSAAAPLGR